MSYVCVDWPNLAEKKQAYKFPNIASDILSTMNDRIAEFFSNVPKPMSFVHCETFIRFFIDMKDVPNRDFNYTRSSYICKILNAMIVHRSGVFAVYFLNHEDFASLLIASSHCKSVCFTLLTFVTLLTWTSPTALIMGTSQPVFERQGEMPKSTLSEDLVSQSLERRMNIFNELVYQCLQTFEHEEFVEVHENLVWVISQILNKNCIERVLFVNSCLEKLPLFVESIALNFENVRSDRLLSLFLTIFDIMIKESAADTDFEQEYCIQELPLYLSIFIKALGKEVALENSIRGEKRQVTNSAATEFAQANSKTYKVLELVNLATGLYISNINYVQEVLVSTGLSGYLFSFYTNYPLNNVLHNLVTKLLLLILRKGSDELADFYFAENEAFVQFIDYLTKEKQNQQEQDRNKKIGFIGQTISILNELKQKCTNEMKTFSQGEVIRVSLEEVH